MILDWELINQYYNNGLLDITKHSEYDLWILNYTPKVQFEKLWDDLTLISRGLVINGNGEVIAQPFKKFFNYYEVNDIDFDQNFDVFEKIDGSLIILFYYNKTGEWLFLSRRSFISEHVEQAKLIFDYNNFKYLDTKCTYIFELIGPNNKIVVDYDENDLILLSRIETNNGIELFYDDLLYKYSKYFNIVKKLKLKTYSDIIDYKRKYDNSIKYEGIVVRFENGERIKIKFDMYVQMHKLIMNLTDKNVWNILQEDGDEKRMIDLLPDELYDWFKKRKLFFNIQYDHHERLANIEFINIFYRKNKRNRSEFAEEAKKSKYVSILFSIYNNQDYSKLIWKMIKP